MSRTNLAENAAVSPVLEGAALREAASCALLFVRGLLTYADEVKTRDAIRELPFGSERLRECLTVSVDMEPEVISVDDLLAQLAVEDRQALVVLHGKLCRLTDPEDYFYVFNGLHLSHAQEDMLGAFLGID